MKVTTNEEGIDKDVEYPCLMKITNGNGTIVLKTSPTDGMVIKQGSSNYKTGEFVTCWGKYFKPFNGSITLEND